MAFDTGDTIVATATPPGRGGIGVVRVSGPEAHAIARALITHTTDLQPRHATLTTVRLSAAAGAATKVVSRTADDVRDHAIVTYFPAPASYTGDDVVEVSVHGSPVVLRAIVAAAIDRGARAAEPGEFTLRAFLNGRIDLMQAEAVADLIDSATPLQARAAFDQLEGTLTRAIAGIDAGLFDRNATSHVRRVLHFVNRGDAGDRFGRKGPDRIRHGTNQAAVDIDRTAAHPGGDTSLRQRASLEPREDQVAVRSLHVVKNAKYVGFELLQLRAFEDGSPDSGHPGFDFAHGHEGSGGRKGNPAQDGQ